MKVLKLFREICINLHCFKQNNVQTYSGKRIFTNSYVMKLQNQWGTEKVFGGMLLLLVNSSTE